MNGLVEAVREWLRLLWISLSVGGRFVVWRIRLWRQRNHLIESLSMKKRTLLFIRHGQTTWNIEHRLPGQLPGIHLNEIGRQQAARLAEALTIMPISTIISSPLERAHETAEYIQRGRDLTIQFEPGLMDTDVGPWAGKVIADLNKEDPAWKDFVKDPTVGPEGVETFPQVQQRVVAAVERWLERDDIGAYPVFVAHADVIKLILASYTGLAPARAVSMTIDNASVSLVEIEKEHPPLVVGISWSPHPGWLKPPTSEPTKDVSVSQEVQEEGEKKA